MVIPLISVIPTIPVKKEIYDIGRIVRFLWYVNPSNQGIPNNPSQEGDL
jgi:hypothetical protein